MRCKKDYYIKYGRGHQVITKEGDICPIYYDLDISRYYLNSIKGLHIMLTKKDINEYFEPHEKQDQDHQRLKLENIEMFQAISLYCSENCPVNKDECESIDCPLYPFSEAVSYDSEGV